MLKIKIIPGKPGITDLVNDDDYYIEHTSGVVICTKVRLFTDDRDPIFILVWPIAEDDPHRHMACLEGLYILYDEIVGYRKCESWGAL